MSEARSKVAAPLVAVMLLLLPVLYVLSLGPLVWLDQRGHLENRTLDAATSCYVAPSGFVAERSEIADAMLTRYMELWE